MKKTARSRPAKAPGPVEDQDDATVRQLLGLALDLTELDAYASPPDELKKKKSDLEKAIRKCLHRQRDAALAEALEQTREENRAAYLLLKESVEEAAQNVVFRREQGPELEVTAFVIPLLVHTQGGLQAEQCFQDEDAFEQLRRSFQDGELESRQANVVLVSHAYHVDEIERIGYGQLREMAREAFDAMVRRKAVATPAIARSMSGWPENRFAPGDRAVELRYLLGFAMKPVDDPFYQVPQKEAAADRYFEARAERFRRWSQQAAPLLKRCLASAERDVDIDFLYQDLFYGAKETGIAEYAMLQMMSELGQALDAHGAAADTVHAILGPAEIDDETLLRVQLQASDGALLASYDKRMGALHDLQAEVEDACDALATIGIRAFAVAKAFDADGRALAARPHALP